jgi:hypothetical protein
MRTRTEHSLRWTPALAGYSARFTYFMQARTISANFAAAAARAPGRK